MAEKEHDEGINLTQGLYELNAKFERIDGKLDLLVAADDKADKALTKSTENERDLLTLKKWVYALFGAVSMAIVIPLFIYMVEKVF